MAGDRQSDGVFPLWSITRNISIGSLREMSVAGSWTLRPRPAWQRPGSDRLAIRTPDMEKPILSLSGGNQQKALFARALGSQARHHPHGRPMRGVDVGTKREVYGLIREEAARGRTFLWYTTETDELEHCDHVYVFREGAIVADLSRDELTEEKLLHASFGDDA